MILKRRNLSPRQNYLLMEKDSALDVTVVIRAAGERTEELCQYIVEQQVPKEQVFVIHEKPFWKAVQRTFEIGIEQGRKWTLAVDADVLLKEGALTEMIARASSYGNSLYVYQGHVMDFIFGRIRPGGPHLYQSEYFHLLSFEDEALKNSLRPESDTYKILAKKGKMMIQDSLIFGIHDYFQYQKDLYRKAFFHAKKHRNHSLVGEFILTWSDQISKNEDYLLLREAFLKGLEDHVEDVPDLNQMGILFSDAGHTEKNKPITKKEYGELQLQVSELTHSPIGTPKIKTLGVPASRKLKMKRKAVQIYQILRSK